ncbi:alpha/beta hydrolase [Penicillium herquei]|nr:alpha/beta hydrolase [Penicillium herquei]
MEKVTEKIDLDDPRIERRSSIINAKIYGYLYAEPAEKYSNTIFLIHGFPDLSMGWRYQIPFLLKLGLRVICPDCIGYGRSGSPTSDINLFSWKSQSEDLYLLAKSLNCESILLAGHDCGSVLASRIVLYYPDFVTRLILLGAPYFPPSQQHISLSTLVKLQPSFQYMLQFGSEDGEVERHTQTREGIRNFLNTLFGGLTQDGKRAITAAKGIDFELSSQLALSNVYRMWDQNSRDELPIAQGADGGIIKCPVLFVRATEDFAITVQMVDAMKAYIPHLEIEDIQSGHWVMLSRPQKVNEILDPWLQQQTIIA